MNNMQPSIPRITQVAVDLNSLGVSLMAQGDCLKAREAFVTTLALLSQTACASDLNSGQKAQAFQQGFPTIPCSPQETHRTAQRLSRGQGTRPPSCQVGNRSFVYDQALVFGPSCDITSNLPFYTSVLMYNVGLTFHVAGCSQEDQRSLSLAARCYATSMQHLVTSYYACENPLLLFVILLNNLAEVYCRLGEHANCRKLLFALCTVMVNESGFPFLEECVVDGFVYNMLSLPVSPLHASAA